MKYLVFKKGNISKSHKNKIEMYSDTDGDEWKVMEAVFNFGGYLINWDSQGRSKSMWLHFGISHLIK